MLNNLVERGPEQIAKLMAQPNAERFQAGDIIEFQKIDGWKWPVTILGRDDAGNFDMMFYTGKPWLFTATEEQLSALRIVRVERMKEIDLTLCRCELGLQEWPAEMAA